MCSLINDHGKPPSRSPSSDFDYHCIASGNRQAFACYCDYFYNPTFSIIARFTGIGETDVLCFLTESVFLQLWGDRKLFAQYSGGYLFRVTMQVTIRYLKERGNYQRAKEIEDAVNLERILRAVQKHYKDGKKP